MRTDATILGGGVVGLCLAAELSARGAKPTLIDRAGAPGPHHCSWWAGGMLAPFCEAEAAEEPVVRHGKQAAEWWAAQGVALIREGSLVVTLERDRRELDRFARRTEAHQTLDREAIARIEPQLEGRHERALFFAGEAHLNPRPALARLRETAATRGVRFETRETSVEALLDATTGLVFDCRGLEARDAMPDLRGVKGEMVVLRAPEIELKRPVRLLHPRHPLYIVPRGDGVFMLGATQIESGQRSRPTLRSVMELLSSAYALHPAFGEAEILEFGVDARPAFPDNLPRIRRRGRVIRINGLFRHGYLLSPACARMAADLAETGDAPEFCDENFC